MFLRFSTNIFRIKFVFPLERLCMPALSVCFWTPRLSLGYPGSFKSAHDLKCMRTQTAPLFNVPRGRRGTTSWSSSTPLSILHNAQAGNRTRAGGWGRLSAKHCTIDAAIRNKSKVLSFNSLFVHCPDITFWERFICISVCLIASIFPCFMSVSMYVYLLNLCLCFIVLLYAYDRKSVF